MNANRITRMQIKHTLIMMIGVLVLIPGMAIADTEGEGDPAITPQTKKTQGKPNQANPNQGRSNQPKTQANNNTLIARNGAGTADSSYGSAGLVRIKDIADMQGVRGNQLIGYGLVVGLDGTGDGQSSQFTIQGVVNMLR